jgi:DNA-binding MarR family transcriptional regulator
MSTAEAAEVDAVRSFNRFWTNKIGLLNAGLLETPYSLTEARVIFELAQRPSTDMMDLRRTLEVDSGYLSRILGRFKADGLVETAVIRDGRLPPGLRGCPSQLRARSRRTILRARL